MVQLSSIGPWVVSILICGQLTAAAGSFSTIITSSATSSLARPVPASSQGSSAPESSLMTRQTAPTQPSSTSADKSSSVLLGATDTSSVTQSLAKTAVASAGINDGSRASLLQATNFLENAPYTFPNGSVATLGPGAAKKVQGTGATGGTIGTTRTSVTTTVSTRATGCSEMYAACMTAEPSQSSLFASRQKACYTPTVSTNYKDPQYTSTGNNTCDNAQGTSSHDLFDAIDVNPALDQFQDLWKNNKLFCTPCLGLFKCECPPEHLSSCDKGLRDASKVPGSNDPRIDVALSLWTGWSAGDTIRCGVRTDSSPTACGFVDCASVKNSGPLFAVVKGITFFNNYLQTSYEQLGAANAKSGEWAQKFQELFAPVKKPDNTGRTFAAAMLALISGGIGFLPEVGKVAKDLGSAVAIAGGMAAWPTAQQEKPADFGPLIANISTFAQWGIGNLSQSVFRNGVLQGKDHNTDIIDLMRDGKMLKLQFEDGWSNPIEPIWERQIFQQLGVQAWGVDDTLFPFITFTDGKCEDLKSADFSDKFRSPIPEEGIALERIKSRINYDGKCIWLLSAKAVSGKAKRLMGSTGQSYNFCANLEDLPGLDKLNSGDFGGLALEDFIVPSYDGWKQNNYHNGFDMLGSVAGSLAPNPRAPGALNIPVCDYMTDPLRPGIGCPKMDKDAAGSKCANWDTYGEAKNELVVFPNNGIYAPGSCFLKLSMFQYSKWNKAKGYQEQGDFYNNPDFKDYQLQVIVSDAEGKVIGNAAKAAIWDVWQVWNTFLPFDILIAAPNLDQTDLPFQIWYADQYFKSTDVVNGKKRCEGGWGGFGKWNLIDEIHCNFDCPAWTEGKDPIPKSATIDHPLPKEVGVQPVVPFGDAAYNTYNTAIKVPPKAEDDPRKFKDTDRSAGNCWVQIVQYGYGWEGVEPWYQFEAYLTRGGDGYDMDKQYAPFANSMQPAPPDQAMPIYGRQYGMSVTFPADSNKWFRIKALNYKGEQDEFDGDDKGHKCTTHEWAEGHRASTCQFNCY